MMNDEAIDMRKRTGLVLWIAALSLCIGWGCEPGEDTQPDVGDDVDEADTEYCGDYEIEGPYSVGLKETQLEDGTPFVVFYPAADGAADEPRVEYDMRDFLPEDDRELIDDEDAPLFEINAASDVEASGDGPFELVVFSHGMAGYRLQSSRLLAHLAGWGFVVASAEHEERNLAQVLEDATDIDDQAPQTVRQMVDALGELNSDGDSTLHEVMDVDRIAATGHSMGGNATSSMLEEPEVQAAIFYGSNASAPEEASVPLMWQGGGTDDLVTLSQIRDTYEQSDPPKSLLGLEEAGHLAFADICAIGAEDGGVLQIAADSGIDVPYVIEVLGEDGCRSTDLDVQKGWPIIHHYSVAHLRDAFGIDEDPVGLDDDTAACFDEITDLEWQRHL